MKVSLANSSRYLATGFDNMPKGPSSCVCAEAEKLIIINLSPAQKDEFDDLDGVSHII